MAKEKISGIYKIENLVNNKVYIGSSKNIYKRWADHKNSLRNNKHHSIHLQRSWNKYKEESFEFAIIEKCFEADLILKEQYWIDFYKSYDINIGYNISTTAKGVILPLEFRIELAKRRRKLSDKKFNEVLDYLINTDIPLYKVAEICNVNKSTISQIYFKTEYFHFTQDLIFIKRENKGEKSPNAQLSEKDVLEIIPRLQNGENCVEIAKDYNIKSKVINEIKLKSTWKHLTSGVDFKTYTCKGSNSAVSKISEYDAKLVKILIAYKHKYILSLNDISKMTSVPLHTVKKISQGVQWKHIETTKQDIDEFNIDVYLNILKVS